MFIPQCCTDNSCISCVPLLVLLNSECSLTAGAAEGLSGTSSLLTQSLSSANNVTSIDICFMSNSFSHCCLTYLLKIILGSHVRKLMNLSAGKGHYCNEVPGSCKATSCIPMFPSHNPIVIFFSLLLSLWFTSDQGQHCEPYNKMFFSQIGLIFVKPSLGHH